MSYKATTFSIAHTDISQHPFNNAQRTVRLLVPNNLSGDGIYIKFSNYYATRPVWVQCATIALSDKGELIPDTSCPITVHGDTSFAIVPQRDVYSDLIKMTVTSGKVFAISLYYPLEDKVTSGNFIGNFAQRSLKGNFCEAKSLQQTKLWTKLSHSFMPNDLSSATTTLSSVIVNCSTDAKKPRVVAAFGDSIMQQGAWTTPFTLRLYHKYPNEISFCNLGIGGNRLLHDSPDLLKGFYGKKGIDRYVHDLLPIEGLTHVIFCLGTNDIGLPGKDGTPESQLITIEEYVTAVQALVAELKQREIKIFCGTLLPREISGVYTQEREALRIAVNKWIRTSDIFDAVIDFEAMVIDDKDGIGMKKEYVLADGLHPDVAGGRVIAENIDLELFK